MRQVHRYALCLVAAAALCGCSEVTAPRTASTAAQIVGSGLSLALVGPKVVRHELRWASERERFVVKGSHLNPPKIGCSYHSSVVVPVKGSAATGFQSFGAEWVVYDDLPSCTQVRARGVVLDLPGSPLVAQIHRMLRPRTSPSMQLRQGGMTVRSMTPVGPSFDQSDSPDFAYYPSSAAPTNQTPETQTASAYYYTGDYANAMWDFLKTTFYYTPGPPWSQCINAAKGFGGYSWEPMTGDGFWHIQPYMPADASASGDCTAVVSHSYAQFTVSDWTGQCDFEIGQATFSLEDYTHLTWDSNTGNPYLYYDHSNNIEGTNCFQFYAQFGYQILYEMPGRGDVGSV